MSHRRWLGLPLAFLWLGLTTPALPQTIGTIKHPVMPLQAQPRPSHHIDQSLGDFKGLEAALKERLSRAENLNNTQKQLHDMLGNKDVLEKLTREFKFTPQDIENARRNLRRNSDLLNDPELQKFLGQFGPGKSLGQELNPAQLSKIKEFVEKFGGKLSATGTAGRTTQPDKTSPLPAPPPRDNGRTATDKSGANTGDLSQHSGELPGSSSSGRSFEDFVKRQLDNFANNLDSGDSGAAGAALRDALQELTRTNFARDGMKLSLDGWEGKLDFLPRLGDLFNGQNLPTPDLSLLRDLRHLSPSDLPRVRLPSFGGKVSFPSMPTMPSMPSLGGMPRGPSVSAGEAGTGLVWAALVVMLAVLAWKGREWYKEGKAAREKPGWQPGDWPVAPGQVTTRANLVRAFEYLALLCLGPSAGTCNHRDLADQLGRQGQADSPARRHAAAWLAALYEQVRYAPAAARPNEPLPDHDRAAARQALCFLAGVTPA